MPVSAKMHNSVGAELTSGILAPGARSPIEGALACSRCRLVAEEKAQGGRIRGTRPGGGHHKRGKDCTDRTGRSAIGTHSAMDVSRETYLADSDDGS